MLLMTIIEVQGVGAVSYTNGDLY